MLAHGELKCRNQNLQTWRLQCGFQADGLHSPTLISRTPKQRLLALMMSYMQGWAKWFTAAIMWNRVYASLWLINHCIIYYEQLWTYFCPPVYSSSHISPASPSHLDGCAPLVPPACHPLPFYEQKKGRVTLIPRWVHCQFKLKCPLPFGLNSAEKWFYLEFIHNSSEVENTTSQHVNVCAGWMFFCLISM